MASVIEWEGGKQGAKFLASHNHTKPTGNEAKESLKEVNFSF